MGFGVCGLGSGALGCRICVIRVDGSGIWCDN